MSLNEEAVVFGKVENLVGIVSEPTDGEANGNEPAFVLLNAGLVHRVGPNRFYVTLARELAKAGHVTLRFDYSGVGDSDPLGNSLSSDLGIVQCSPPHVGKRCLPTNDLGHHAGNQVVILAKLFVFIRILIQCKHSAADGIPGGIVAADNQQNQIA